MIMINGRYIFLIFLVATLLSSCGIGDDDSGVSFEEQLAIDIAAIDNYLTENSISTEVHPSGIRFIRTKQGTGESPANDDDIAAKFEAYLLDGTLLGQDTIGFTINLNETVEAWKLMVPEIQEGGKMTIYTPSGYAVNSILRYEVELLAKIDNSAEQLSVDTLIIEEYLAENKITFEEDDTGIRFSTLNEGTGSSPTLADEVRVRFEGRFLNGETFDQSSAGGSQFPLEAVIEAWQIMLPKMKEGGIIEIYVPSLYAYGEDGVEVNGVRIIPPNTILIFEIELIGIR